MRVLFVGPSRAGKDEAGSWLARHSRLRYAGSISQAVCPLVAESLGLTPEEAYARRHQNRDYWRAFCDGLRREDPTKLVRICLEKADIVTGTRALPEMLAVLEARLFDRVVWIDNPRVPVDPTLEFGAELATHVVRNDADLESYHYALTDLFSDIPGFFATDLAIRYPVR